MPPHRPPAQNCGNQFCAGLPAPGRLGWLLLVRRSFPAQLQVGSHRHLPLPVPLPRRRIGVRYGIKSARTCRAKGGDACGENTEGDYNRALRLFRGYSRLLPSLVSRRSRCPVAAFRIPPACCSRQAPARFWNQATPGNSVSLDRRQNSLAKSCFGNPPLCSSSALKGVIPTSLHWLVGIASEQGAALVPCYIHLVPGRAVLRLGGPVP